ncbi:19342_t:CDS:2 [Gigaspora margarita]|uniref:19342_t:CDS:1 n=1 Tax=Gigaspora margarita TaxID=4874 RepID=A0ABN7VU30_GIGMA|nr:19342_t:CDS:2 [Gigaspora margarita]
MGWMQLPLSSDNKKIRIENTAINYLQLERARLIEYLLYHDKIDNLLISWSKKIYKIALDSVPTKKGTQWIVIWLTNLESHLNNYKCTAYLLLEKAIKFSFKQLCNRQHRDLLIIDQTESWIIPQNIITLESSEASKFLYIIGWVVYKLVKSDPLTMAHEDFIKIRSCLNALSTENIEYEGNTCSKKTMIIPGTEFVQFMYYLESLILQLFEKHEYVPEKGSSSLRENVKAINADLKNITKKNNPKAKSFVFKKDMLPEDPSLALAQLKIWVHGDGAKNAFEKAFTLSELKILVQVFQVKPLELKGKKIRICGFAV